MSGFSDQVLLFVLQVLISLNVGLPLVSYEGRCLASRRPDLDRNGLVFGEVAPGAGGLGDRSVAYKPAGPIGVAAACVAGVEPVVVWTVGLLMISSVPTQPTLSGLPCRNTASTGCRSGCFDPYNSLYASTETAQGSFAMFPRGISDATFYQTGGSAAACIR